jgi:hypothetical protein
VESATLPPQPAMTTPSNIATEPRNVRFTGNINDAVPKDEWRVASRQISCRLRRYVVVAGLGVAANGAALRPGFRPRFLGALGVLAAFGRPGFRPRFFGTAVPSAFSFLAFRASRNFLILALGKSLCLAHTIPKTGAAGFLQPGTGQSWSGAFFLGFFAGAFAITSWGIAEA